MSHLVDTLQRIARQGGNRPVERQDRPSTLEIRIVRDEAGFSTLRDEWDGLVDDAAVTVYQTFDWLFLWWKHFGAHPSRTLSLVTFRDNGVLTGVAPFFIETVSVVGVRLQRRLRMLGCGVAHRGSRGMFTRYGVTDYLDVIARRGYEPRVAQKLADYLQGTAAQYDEIEFVEISGDSFVNRVLMPELENRGIPCIRTPLDICPCIHLPGDYETFVRGCSKRMHRYIPKARGMFDAAIEEVQTDEALDMAVQELIRLHQRRWNRTGYPGLFANRRYRAFQEELLRRLWERGLVWCKLVRVDGRYIAADLGFAYKDRIYDYLSGFDIDAPYAKHSPALTLQMSIVEDAIRNPEIRSVDLLRGNEKYKLEMTSDYRQNWRIILPNPATRRTGRMRLSRCVALWRAAVQRVSKEGLIVKVHYQEHGLTRFAARYLAFRKKRVFRRDTQAAMKKTERRSVADAALNFSLVQKIRQSLNRDSDLPLSRKLLKGWIFLRAMLTAKLYLLGCDAVGKRARTRCRPYIDNAGRIVIGDDFNLNSRIVRSELATGHKGVLEIGDGVVVNYGAAICAHERVRIGDRVHLGPYVSIMDSDFHGVRDRAAKAGTAPVAIEDDAWLGNRVIVLKGSTIGKGAVITAGSVVSGDIPAGVLAGGNPARVIRRLDEAEETPASAQPGQPAPAPVQTKPKDAVAERVTAVFSKVFTLNGPVNFAWGPKDIARWDSLGHLNLMFGIESEFGIALSEDDLMSLNSVGEVYETVKKYMDHPSAS